MNNPTEEAEAKFGAPDNGTEERVLYRVEEDRNDKPVMREISARFSPKTVALSHARLTYYQVEMRRYELTREAAVVRWREHLDRERRAAQVKIEHIDALREAAADL